MATATQVSTGVRDQLGDHLLTRDWARLETVQEVVQIVLTDRLLKEE